MRLTSMTWNARDLTEGKEKEMIWPWWGAMVVVGLIVGCVGAWTQGIKRVFMKTLAVPLVLLLSRLLLPGLYPLKNTPTYLFLDFILIAISALSSDYFLGLKLGRHDRAGYRSDSVGH